MDILSKRGYVIVLGTKPRDETLEGLERDHGYKLVRRMPLPAVEIHPRIVFWPKSGTVENIVEHRSHFKRLLGQIYSSGNWTVVFDELRYFTDPHYLRLGSFAEIL